MSGKKVDWSSLKNQHEWKQELQHLLCTSDEAVIQAMLRIWDLQSINEKLANQSLEENGIGFDKIDSRVMGAYVAKHSKGQLDREDILDIRRRMLKYWKQLMKLSKMKLERKSKENASGHAGAASSAAAPAAAEEVSKKASELLCTESNVVAASNDMHLPDHHRTGIHGTGCLLAN